MSFHHSLDVGANGTLGDAVVGCMQSDNGEEIKDIAVGLILIVGAVRVDREEARHGDCMQASVQDSLKVDCTHCVVQASMQSGMEDSKAR